MSGIDLAIGTKFHFDNKLFEVAEGTQNCSSCVFYKQKIFEGSYYGETDICYAIACCSEHRKDKKDVHFKEVEE